MSISRAQVGKILENAQNGIVSKISNTPPESLRVYDVWNFATLQRHNAHERPHLLLERRKLPPQLLQATVQLLHVVHRYLL